MQTSIRTTMNFSPAFHLLLKRISEQTGKAMGDIIEEKLTPVLTEQDKAQLKRQYDGLLALQGMVKDNIPDASATIDEVLYGQGWEEHE
jgi:hypothetical protein